MQPTDWSTTPAYSIAVAIVLGLLFFALVIAATPDGDNDDEDHLE